MLEGLPILKKTVQHKINAWQTQREEWSAEDGIEASLNARLAIRRFTQKQEEEN